MILIEHPETGERCLVESTTGYDGWLLICDKVEPPENEDCEWCDQTKRFKPDNARRARNQKLRTIRDPEALLDLIESLTSRIEALEARGR
jgi:hypothetical protein